MIYSDLVCKTAQLTLCWLFFGGNVGGHRDLFFHGGPAAGLSDAATMAIIPRKKSVETCTPHTAHTNFDAFIVQRSSRHPGLASDHDRESRMGNIFHKSADLKKKPAIDK